MKVDGEGRRKILIYGEAPGKDEDKEGRPFVGRTGQYLTNILSRLEVDLRRDCWIANSLRCHPKTPEGSNRKPTPLEISHCRPNLMNSLRELKPELVIPLGGSATDSLMGYLWKEDSGQGKKEGGIFRWLGWQIPSQKINAWVCPSWHPSFVCRELSDKNRKKGELVERLFISHLKSALTLEGRPWKTVPNYASKVRCVYDPEEAAQRLNAVVRKAEATGSPLAFDLETNMLKPDSSRARIVCCSVSDGETTLAYPWVGEVIKATKEMSLSPVTKIGANQRFEERWWLKFFGHGVRNWGPDVVLDAHVLDNRRRASSVKFQAFVCLGQDSWDAHISPYLKAGSANEENKIREFIEKYGLGPVLTYCGLDSYLEYLIAQKQSIKRGVKNSNGN